MQSHPDRHHLGSIKKLKTMQVSRLNTVVVETHALGGSTTFNMERKADFTRYVFHKRGKCGGGMLLPVVHPRFEIFMFDSEISRNLGQWV